MSYRDVLSIPAFRNLWLGQAISMLGDAFYFVTFMFMVKKITGSDAMVGYVGAVNTLPFLVFAPFAGVLADRIDRRKILLVSDILSGLGLAAFAVLAYLDPQPPVAAIFAIAFLTSAMRVFFIPAKNASIAAIVPAPKLLLANSLNMATQNMMPMIALSLSASVLAILYEWSVTLFFSSAVALNAASFLLSAYFVAKLPPILPDRSQVTEQHPLTDLREGFAHIIGRPVLKVLMVLQGCLSLLISPFFVVYVAANDQWFGGKPSTLAWFECAFFAGMVLMSFAVGKMNLRHPGQGFIWGLSVVGIGVLAMGFMPHFWPFLLLNLICGLAIPFAEIPVSTWVQTTTPDAYRGRVNSALTMVQMGVTPIGYSLGGLLVSGMGLVAAFVLMGVGMAASALAGLLHREFRRSRIPDDPSPAMVLQPVPSGSAP